MQQQQPILKQPNRTPNMAQRNLTTTPGGAQQQQQQQQAKQNQMTGLKNKPPMQQMKTNQSTNQLTANNETAFLMA